jgi:protein-tyrosine phosphatase
MAEYGVQRRPDEGQVRGIMLAELDHGLANLRDIGGLSLAGGGRTAFGQLYRSDAPMAGELAPDLRPWPPPTVIDLRSHEEMIAPTHPMQRDGVTVHSLPIISAANPVRMAIAGPDFNLVALYLAMANNCGDRIALVVDAIASADGACLVHCAVGKDRTGVVVALVLSALGADRATILTDYQRTGANMPAVLDRLVRTRAAEEQETLRVRLAGAPAGMFDTDVTAIEQVLDLVESHDGGVAGWLMARGLPAAQLDRLYEKLVTTAPR